MPCSNPLCFCKSCKCGKNCRCGQVVLLACLVVGAGLAYWLLTSKKLKIRGGSNKYNIDLPTLTTSLS